MSIVQACTSKPFQPLPITPFKNCIHIFRYLSQQCPISQYQKPILELPGNLAIALLDICLKEVKSGSQRIMYTVMFMEALFTIGKIWK